MERNDALWNQLNFPLFKPFQQQQLSLAVIAVIAWVAPKIHSLLLKRVRNLKCPKTLQSKTEQRGKCKQCFRGNVAEQSARCSLGFLLCHYWHGFTVNCSRMQRGGGLNINSDQVPAFLRQHGKEKMLGTTCALGVPFHCQLLAWNYQLFNSKKYNATCPLMYSHLGRPGVLPSALQRSWRLSPSNMCITMILKIEMSALVFDHWWRSFAFLLLLCGGSCQETWPHVLPAKLRWSLLVQSLGACCVLKVQFVSCLVPGPFLEFPAFLSDSLEVLYLNDNQLDSIPQSVCLLKGLTELYLGK